MPFQKGQSGNPAGRPKGKPNKATDNLRRLVGDLLQDNFTRLQKDLDKLTPRERVHAFTQLLEYALPKLSRADDSLSVDLSKMTDEAVERLADEILNRIDDDD